MTASTTRRRVAGLAAASAAVIALGVAPALADSAGYVGPGDVTACRAPGPLSDPVPPVELPGLGVGSTCFGIPTGAAAVTITVNDDVGTPPAFFVEARVPGQTLNVQGPTFCSGSGTWTLPAGADELVVSLSDPVTAGCANAGVGVKGAVTATFS